MTRSKKTKPPAISDAATQYALEVVAGERIAGPHVRGQCARHLRDIESGHKRGLVWKVEAAEKAQGFFEDVLKLNGGDFEGKPFALMPVVLAHKLIAALPLVVGGDSAMAIAEAV